MTGRDPAAFLERFRIPLIAAPMTVVSGRDLTLAAALVDRLEQELTDAEVTCQQRTRWSARP